MKPPIFIIGSPRSGTTLFRLMLTAHRNIVIPPECGFAVWWYPQYTEWEANAGAAQTARFAEDVIRAKKFDTWGLDGERLTRYLLDRNPPTYAQAVSAVYEFYGLAHGRSFQRWGDKNNFHVHHVDTLHTLYPEARFIHIVRDIRDIICSFVELAGRHIDSPYAPHLPTQIEEAVALWQTNVADARASFARIGGSQECEIRFEDVVLNTEQSLRGVCAFLDEPYDENMLSYYRVNADEELEPKDFLQWKEKTTQPPNREVVGRYRRDLGAEEIRKIEALACREMALYGYVASERQ